MTNIGFIGSALLTAALVGCSASRPEPWRGCLLCSDSGRLPGLQRQADPGPPTLAAQPHCAPLPGPGLPDEPEAVDDLDALLDRGQVCGPDGKLNRSHPCQPLSAGGWQVRSGPTPSNSAPYCSGASPQCPNQTLTIVRGDDPPLLLELYDDPSSHRTAEMTQCTGGASLSPCYYRLGRVSLAMRL